MNVRSIKASEPCARTMASLDDSITVAKTGDSTVLFNLPRNIEDIDSKTTRATGIGGRIRELFR
ncbi:hypothetical protein [Corynebacterium sp. LK2510]|uniref:hypothetical protein n=1 Tax=Corynebacterium sp. LK2510 TaxID=3110472 RepID=UPI0034CEC884